MPSHIKAGNEGRHGNKTTLELGHNETLVSFHKENIVGKFEFRIGKSKKKLLGGKCEFNELGWH